MSLLRSYRVAVLCHVAARLSIQCILLEHSMHVDMPKVKVFSHTITYLLLSMFGKLITVNCAILRSCSPCTQVSSLHNLATV